MSTAATRNSEIANGAAREVKAISRRAAQSGRKLGHTLTTEGAAMTRRAGELLQSSARSARRHPWATTGVVLAAAALIGGLLWTRRR